MTGDTLQWYLQAISSIEFDDNVFTTAFGEDKVLLGYFAENDPGLQRFINFGTIYLTVLDHHKKIQLSLRKAAEYAEYIENYDIWNPFELLAENERLAIYYTENAIFRVEILWDLLAQLYNQEHQVGMRVERINAKSFFGSLEKTLQTDLSKRIVAYMDSEYTENPSDLDSGNYKMIKDYRNRLTHRITPNITSFSEISTFSRQPMMFLLIAVIGDYSMVSDFIKELMIDISEKYKELEKHFIQQEVVPNV